MQVIEFCGALARLRKGENTGRRSGDSDGGGSPVGAAHRGPGLISEDRRGGPPVKRAEQERRTEPAPVSARPHGHRGRSRLRTSPTSWGARHRPGRRLRRAQSGGGATGGRCRDRRGKGRDRRGVSRPEPGGWQPRAVPLRHPRLRHPRGLQAALRAGTPPDQDRGSDALCQRHPPSGWSYSSRKARVLRLADSTRNSKSAATRSNDRVVT